MIDVPPIDLQPIAVYIPRYRDIGARLMPRSHCNEFHALRMNVLSRSITTHGVEVHCHCYVSCSILVDAVAAKRSLATASGRDKAT